jgi:GT2 family glycosyltransferase
MSRHSTYPLVFVVVLNSNGWADTRECLTSLRRLDYENRVVVVVDNGSSDDSEVRIRRDFPEATVLQAGENLGFSRGNNLGIRHALTRGAAFVWLLNNDTTADSSALTALVKEAETDARIGIVGSVLYFADQPERVQAWGGGTFNALLGKTSCSMKPTAASELDFITGASMLVRRDFLEDVGLLDETFFFYMEDTDLCFRAKQHSWRIAVAEESVVYHKVGATINAGSRERSLDGDRAHVLSNGIFLGKHSGAALLVAVPLNLAGMVLMRIRRRQFRRLPSLVSEFMRGLRLGLRGRRLSAPETHRLWSGFSRPAR